MQRTSDNQSAEAISRIAALLEQGDMDRLRAALMAGLAARGAASWLRALDAAGLLTRIIPELEPARATEQPIVHFLPVLAHSIETVAAGEWLLGQIQQPYSETGTPGDWARPGREALEQRSTPDTRSVLPAAIQNHPDLRYRSVYAAELREHFAGAPGRSPRAALFKLAALLHDIAKPWTRRSKPGGGASFHEHQTIGGEIAHTLARRLGFDATEAGYIRTVVRAHMRPGQLAVQGDVTLRAVRRFFQSTGDAGPDVLIFLLADHMATRGPLMRVESWLAQVEWIDALLERLWGEVAPLAPPLVNGDDLMRELGIAPGPLLGQLLAVVGEAQAGDTIATPAEALALARSTWERLKSGTLEG